MKQALYAFLDTASACDNLGALSDAASHSLSKFGFTRWAYQSTGRGVTTPLLLHTFPKSWETLYLGENFAALDPVITVGQGMAKAFQWSSLAVPDDERVREYLHTAADYGLQDGYGIPVRSKGNAPSGMVSLVTDLHPGELTAVWDEHAGDIHAISFAFQRFADQLHQSECLAGNADVLTPREKEVLLWTFRGKSAWEIGGIISRTERVVVFHLENAKLKLGAASKLQAVVKAIMEGYICP